MYSIGRNVELNIVKREQYSSNNCATLYNVGRNLLCEQRCRKSGVQCLHKRPATYLTLLERSAVRNEINVQKCAKDSCAQHFAHHLHHHMKKGIKFCDLSVLNFIYFLKKSGPLKFLDKLEQAMYAIFANQSYFTTEDTKWSLPVKPVSNLLIC